MRKKFDQHNNASYPDKRNNVGYQYTRKALVVCGVDNCVSISYCPHSHGLEEIPSDPDGSMQLNRGQGPRDRNPA
jgi:hypothetical protein